MRTRTLSKVATWLGLGLAWALAACSSGGDGPPKESTKSTKEAICSSGGGDACINDTGYCPPECGSCFASVAQRIELRNLWECSTEPGDTGGGGGGDPDPTPTNFIGNGSKDAVDCRDDSSETEKSATDWACDVAKNDGEQQCKASLSWWIAGAHGTPVGTYRTATSCFKDGCEITCHCEVRTACVYK